MLGILVGTDDGLLQIVPGEEPRQALAGLNVTSLDHHDGLTVAGATGCGVWVHMSETWRRLVRSRHHGWERMWDGNPSCVRVAPGGDIYIGAEPPALFSVFPGAFGGNELGALRGALQTDEQLRKPDGTRRPYVAGIAFTDRGPEEALFVGIAGSGVWQAAAGGRRLSFERFERRTDGLDPDLWGLWVHPELPDRLFASTASGFFRSDDAGRSWVQSISGLDRSRAAAAVVLPGTPDVIVLACARRERELDGALFRSSDGGLSWSRVAPGGEDEWEHAPLLSRLWDSEDTVFVVAGDKLWASHDAAASWVRLADGLPPSYALVAAL